MSDQHEWDASEAAVENARMRREQADEKATRPCAPQHMRIDTFRGGETVTRLTCQNCGWTDTYGYLTMIEREGLTAAHCHGHLF